MECGGKVILENPADPGMEPFPSFWLTSPWLHLQSDFDLYLFTGHQCQYGAVTPKITSLGTNIAELQSFHGNMCSHQYHAPQVGWDAAAGAFRTTQLAQYPTLLCKFFAQTIVQSWMDLCCTFSARGAARRFFHAAPFVDAQAHTGGGETTGHGQVWPSAYRKLFDQAPSPSHCLQVPGRNYKVSPVVAGGQHRRLDVPVRRGAGLDSCRLLPHPSGRRGDGTPDDKRCDIGHAKEVSKEEIFDCLASSEGVVADAATS